MLGKKKIPENFSEALATVWFHSKDLQTNTISTLEKSYRYIVWIIFGVSHARHRQIVDLTGNCRKKKGEI